MSNANWVSAKQRSFVRKHLLVGHARGAEKRHAEIEAMVDETKKLFEEFKSLQPSKQEIEAVKDSVAAVANAAKQDNVDLVRKNYIAFANSLSDIKEVRGTTPPISGLPDSNPAIPDPEREKAEEDEVLRRLMEDHARMLPYLGRAKSLDGTLTDDYKKIDILAKAGNYRAAQEELATLKQRISRLLAERERVAATAQSNDRAEKVKKNERVMSSLSQFELQVSNAKKKCVDKASPFLDVAAAKKLMDDGEATASSVLDVVNAYNPFATASDSVFLEKSDADFDKAIELGERFLLAAKKYADEHKNPRRSKGKTRLELCEMLLESGQKRSDELMRLRDATDKTVFEMTKLALSDVRLETLDAVEKLVASSAVSKRAKLRAQQFLIDGRNAIDQAAKLALSKLGPTPTSNQQANALLSYRNVKKTAEGMSDSFFIHDPDGKIAFVFKTQQGEDRPDETWPTGAGAPKEVLTYELSKLLSDVGLDVGVMPTEVARLEDASLSSEGKSSRAKSRIGVLQKGVEVKPGDPVGIDDFFGNEVDPSELKRRLKNVNVQRAQAVAISDLISLNGDRHGGNAILTKNSSGEILLNPIDAGISLPSKASVVVADCASSFHGSIGMAYSDANPKLSGHSLIIPQLPLATKKFDSASQKAIAALDPQKIENEMRSAYLDISMKAPEMSDLIDDNSFIIAGRCARILQKAAPKLTIREIYGLMGRCIPNVASVRESEFEAEIDKAISQIEEIKRLGGDDKIAELQELLPTKMAQSLINNGSLEERLTFLRNLKKTDGTLPSQDDAVNQVLILMQSQVAKGLPNLSASAKEDIKRAKELIAKRTLDPATDGKDLENYCLYLWDNGGDKHVRAILGSHEPTFINYVQRPLLEKNESFLRKKLREFLKWGGHERLMDEIPDQFSAVANKPFEDQYNLLNQWHKENKKAK